MIDKGHRVTVLAFGREEHLVRKLRSVEPPERVMGQLQNNRVRSWKGKCAHADLEEVRAGIPVTGHWGDGTGGSSGLRVL